MNPDGNEQTVASKDKVRQSLHDLQPSAKDKENLVGGGRMLRSNKQSKKTKIASDTTKKRKDEEKTTKHKATYKDKSVQTARGEKIKIEVEDLTSAAGPSENYWEVIAERRRITLEEALIENKELAERNEKLEEKIHLYEQMLDETRALVEVLQDMIGEDGSGINNSLEDSVL